MSKLRLNDEDVETLRKALSIAINAHSKRLDGIKAPALRRRLEREHANMEHLWLALDDGQGRRPVAVYVQYLLPPA